MVVLPFLLLTSSLAAVPSSSTQAAGAHPAGSASSSASASHYTELAKKAEAARAAEHTDEAIELYSELVKLKPSSAENWWYLGTLYYDADRYEEGRKAFLRVASITPGMSLAWAMLGLCEFEVRQYDSALMHLRRADQLKIPNQQGYYNVARYHLALLHTRAGEFEDAIRVLSDLVRRGTDTLQFREAMGIAALRRPLLPAELPPTDRQMVLDVGQAVCDSVARRAEKLDSDTSTILVRYSNVPEVHYIAGSILLPSDPAKALQLWQAELVVSPANSRALTSIAGEYFKQRDFEKALPNAERAVAADPQYYPAHAVLGQVLVDSDMDPERGVKELKRAVQLAPWQPQPHFVLAAAYAKTGRKEDAAKERAEFLKLQGPKESAASNP
ncbi:MAG TPA: tetratricopeptide repeat protein [Candidatus Dormibacteraeota bacterium]|nr:tetratricopeptide repeat protein [Candidatus Dormibacteraeota bacterium]